MKRGEIRTVASGPHYASKPRPAVIIQADRFGDLESVAICLFTSDSTTAQSLRIPVYPTKDNGLRDPSWLMVDKIVTVPKAKLGSCIGFMDNATLAEASRIITIFLDLVPSK